MTLRCCSLRLDIQYDVFSLVLTTNEKTGTEEYLARTVQRNAGRLDELQDVKDLQSDSFPQAHGGERRPPVPAEGSLLLRSDTLNNFTHSAK